MKGQFKKNVYDDGSMRIESRSELSGHYLYLVIGDQRHLFSVAGVLNLMSALAEGALWVERKRLKEKRGSGND